MADVKQLQDGFDMMKRDLQVQIDKLKGPQDLMLSGDLGTPVDIIRAILENFDQRLKQIEDGKSGFDSGNA